MHKRAVAAVVLLVAVVLVAMGILVSQQDAVEPAPAEPPGPTSRTLLVQLRDPTLNALSSVLVGVRKDRLDQLWWTADWWIEQNGRLEVSAADLGRRPVPEVMNIVQNQIQVRVDDAWVMDRLAFAGLVDAVSGVRVDVPEATTYTTEDGLSAKLQQGVQPLTGGQAADYVLDDSLRDEAQRLVRFQSVWDQILRRFPTDTERARTVVVSLGALSKATMPTEQLEGLLSDARDLRVSGLYAEGQVRLDESNSIRVKPVEGIRRAYAVAPRPTQRVVRSVFEGYEPGDAPVARVLSAAPRKPAVQTVRGQLLARGWPSAWGGRGTAGAGTVVVDPGISAADALTVEQALGTQPVRAPVALGDARVTVDDED
jgi:hypothetical protein